MELHHPVRARRRSNSAPEAVAPTEAPPRRIRRRSTSAPSTSPATAGTAAGPLDDATAARTEGSIDLATSRIRRSPVIRREPGALAVREPPGAPALMTGLTQYLPRLPGPLASMVRKLLAAVSNGSLVITVAQGAPLLELLGALCDELVGTEPEPPVEGNHQPMPRGVVAISDVVGTIVDRDVSEFLTGEDMFVPGQWLWDHAPGVFAYVGAMRMHRLVRPDPALPAPSDTTAEEEEAKRKAEEEEAKRKAEEEEAKRKAEEEEAKRKAEEEEAKRKAEEEEAKRKAEEEEAKRKAEEEEAKRKAEEEEAKRKAEEERARRDYRGATSIGEFGTRVRHVCGLIEGQLDQIPEQSKRIGLTVALKGVRTNLKEYEDFLKKGGAFKVDGPRGKKVTEALDKVLKDFEGARVDEMLAIREEARRFVQGVVDNAQQLLAEHPGDGPERDFARSLLKAAKEVLTNAQLEHMMRSKTDVSGIRAQADHVQHEINSARQDIPHFGSVRGDYRERVAQLSTLRSVLTTGEIATLMPLMPPGNGGQRAVELVAMAKAAKTAPLIDLAGLGQLIPIGDVLLLPNAICLAGQMQLTLAHVLQPANLTILQRIAEHIGPTQFGWFAALPWASLTALDLAFTSTQLSDLVSLITRQRFDLLWTNGMRPPAMRHYQQTLPDVLEHFDGIPDQAWSHVAEKIKINKATNAISGGHDRARFNALHAKKGSAMTVTPRAVKPGTPAAITKVHYSIVEPGKPSSSGLKTLILGLATAPAPWRASAERAAWEAVCSQRLLANDEWTGTDATLGFDWTGYHSKGRITTTYPDV